MHNVDAQWVPESLARSRKFNENKNIVIWSLVFSGTISCLFGWMKKNKKVKEKLFRKLLKANLELLSRQLKDFPIKTQYETQ